MNPYIKYNFSGGGGASWYAGMYGIDGVFGIDLAEPVANPATWANTGLRLSRTGDLTILGEITANGTVTNFDATGMQITSASTQDAVFSSVGNGATDAYNRIVLTTDGDGTDAGAGCMITFITDSGGAGLKYSMGNDCDKRGYIDSVSAPVGSSLFWRTADTNLGQKNLNRMELGVDGALMLCNQKEDVTGGDVQGFSVRSPESTVNFCSSLKLGQKGTGVSVCDPRINFFGGLTGTSSGDWGITATPNTSIWTIGNDGDGTSFFLTNNSLDPHPAASSSITSFEWTPGALASSRITVRDNTATNCPTRLFLRGNASSAALAGAILGCTEYAPLGFGGFSLAQTTVTGANVSTNAQRSFNTTKVSGGFGDHCRTLNSATGSTGFRIYQFGGTAMVTLTQDIVGPQIPASFPTGSVTGNVPTLITHRTDSETMGVGAMFVFFCGTNSYAAAGAQIWCIVGGHGYAADDILYFDGGTGDGQVGGVGGNIMKFQLAGADVGSLFEANTAQLNSDTTGEIVIGGFTTFSFSTGTVATGVVNENATLPAVGRYESTEVLVVPEQASYKAAFGSCVVGATHVAGDYCSATYANMEGTEEYHGAASFEPGLITWSGYGPGAGITTPSPFYSIKAIKMCGFYYTEILVDITAFQASASFNSNDPSCPYPPAALDYGGGLVMGAAGASNCQLCTLREEVNGVIFRTKMTCIETPTRSAGDADKFMLVAANGNDSTYLAVQGQTCSSPHSRTAAYRSQPGPFYTILNNHECGGWAAPTVSGEQADPWVHPYGEIFTEGSNVTVTGSTATYVPINFSVGGASTDNAAQSASHRTTILVA